MKAFSGSRRGRPGPGTKKRKGKSKSIHSATERIDLGTPEQQARRRVMVGGGDPKYAEYPLGVLLARRIITQQQHDAGCRYAFLAGRVLGRVGATSSTMEHWYSPDLDDAMLIVEPLWREACDVLAARGRRVKEAVDNATYHRIWPIALIVRPGLAEWDLIDGLEVLEKWRNGLKLAA
jgi:hypothetical protein